MWLSYYENSFPSNLLFLWGFDPELDEPDMF